VGWINRHPLTYTAIVVIALLTGWECLAWRFTLPPPSKAPLETLSLVLHGPDKPLATAVDSPPRLLILGNSQIHYVRDHDDNETYGFPAQLAANLKQLGRSVEVADLSAGGQQVVESLAILIDTFERVRPDHVVLGLGLANMRSTTIPLQLVSVCDWNHIRQEAAALSGDRIAPALSQSLLQLYSPSVPQVIVHDPTIQEQSDELIAEWLTEHSAAVRHRIVMSQWVSKLPGDLEREVRMTWRKKVRKQFKARTYDAGPHYELSLATVQLMAQYCQQRSVPFTVISMPYHPVCEPAVYVLADEQRLDRDLQQLANRREITWLDLTQALQPEHYGRFQDVSIDGLHFLAVGHARLAETVAPQLGNRLTHSVTAVVEEPTTSRH
jgi:lysophospholipase L1-like esterase